MARRLVLIVPTNEKEDEAGGSGSFRRFTSCNSLLKLSAGPLDSTGKTESFYKHRKSRHPATSFSEGIRPFGFELPGFRAEHRRSRPEHGKPQGNLRETPGEPEGRVGGGGLRFVTI